MQGDVEGEKSAEAIAVICSCGKRLKAAPQHAGKQLKCPACGQPTLVPQATRSTSLSANSQPKDELSGANRTVMLSLWGCVALVAIGCVLFVKWHSEGLQAARVDSANQEISAAVAAADAWIADQKKGQSTEIEQRLARAIDVTDATKQADGRSALDRLRARRDLLAQQATIAEAQRKANGLFEEARREIEARRIPEAIALLRKYVEDPHAMHKSDGRQLLAQAEIATSDARTMTILAALSDEEFAKVSETGQLGDGNVSHPVLISVRGEVVKRSLPKDAQRREAMRTAAAEQEDAKRRKEEAELARLREAEAAENARRLRLSTASLLDIADDPEKYVGLTFTRLVWINGSSVTRRKEKNNEDQVVVDGYVLHLAPGDRDPNKADKVGNQFAVIPDELNPFISSKQEARLLQDIISTGYYRKFRVTFTVKSVVLNEWRSLGKRSVAYLADITKIQLPD